MGIQNELHGIGCQLNQIVQRLDRLLTPAAATGDPDHPEAYLVIQTDGRSQKWYSEIYTTMREAMQAIKIHNETPHYAIGPFIVNGALAAAIMHDGKLLSALLGILQDACEGVAKHKKGIDS